MLSISALSCTLPLPSNDTGSAVINPPSISNVLADCNNVVVSALPVKSPVTLPVNTASAALVSNTTDEVLVLTTSPVTSPVKSNPAPVTVTPVKSTVVPSGTSIVFVPSPIVTVVPFRFSEPAVVT